MARILETQSLDWASSIRRDLLAILLLLLAGSLVFRAKFTVVLRPRSLRKIVLGSELWIVQNERRALLDRAAL